MRRLLLPTLALAALACSSDNDSGAIYTTLDDEVGDGDAEGDGDEDEEESGSEGPMLDFGSGEGPGTSSDEGTAEEGCTYVDLLFVIDNSASMTTYQNNLTAAFPLFVDAIFDTLPPGTDLHVGVTTSSFAQGGSHSEVNCEAAESVETMLEYYVKPDEGFVDGNGFQGRLVEHDGLRYFAGDTSNPAHRNELKAWFSNAAKVGSSGGSFEYNASAAAHVFHPANADFNQGFIRDEGAVLVLFILSDEADQSFDVDDAAALKQLVIDAKANCGGENCIVSGGLLSEWCTGGQNASFTFLSSFGEEPVWGSIGTPFGPQPDYSAVVGDALAQVIGETCETIPPIP